MFYCNLEHIIKTQSSKNKSTAKGRFHYITRTAEFARYKENSQEKVEFVQSGNMPKFAEGKPAEFWQAADLYERKNGRVSSSLVTVALPKELSTKQRIELAEQFIIELADRYQFPYTCSIHTHAGSLGGEEQPHLHFMYSERHVDEIDRTPEQFFKRYNPKQPEKGGAQKLTADVLGLGKGQLQLYREKTEQLINHSLERYAPTKILEIKGVKVEVPSFVRCLSNEDYNKKYGTNLQDVPMMNKAIKYAKETDPERYQQKQEMTAEINRIRAENRYELYKTYYEVEYQKQKTLEETKSQKAFKQQSQNKGYDGPSL
ncbi:MobA/MobL family protein (plasmid) [Acinetobacter sp. ESL0695]|uniref:MobA/MobL family protein n=1 Tax=Acinetobacter sp. ESL0695 TaxID=2983215 RepID=UPI0023F1ECA2|nr:MobA/MobL family protein [Acinetobacter sp. ESL0695]WEV50090.1 MobA/MobL family protein [Acinetobacter sp. ESL0695]